MGQDQDRHGDCDMEDMDEDVDWDKVKDMD